jgi:hypothetical protein
MEISHAGGGGVKCFENGLRPSSATAGRLALVGSFLGLAQAAVEAVEQVPGGSLNGIARGKAEALITSCMRAGS